MLRFRSEVPKGLFRLSISITKTQEIWLQNLSNEMKSTGGYKLPKSYIIRALLDAIMTFDININGVKTERELKNRILQTIRK